MHTRTALPLLVCLFLLPCFAAAQHLNPAEANSRLDSLLMASKNLINNHQYDSALTVITGAEQLTLKIGGLESVEYADYCFTLGRIYYFKGNLDNSEKFYLESKNIREKILGRQHIDYAASTDALGMVNLAKGALEKAEPLYLEAKNIREKLRDKYPADYATSLHSTATLYYRMGLLEIAEPLYLEAISIREKVLTKAHINYAASLSNLAGLYYDLGQFEQVEPLCLEAISICDNKMGKENPFYPTFANNLALIYYELGQYEKAEVLHKEAIAIREKILTKNHPDYAQSLHNLALLYHKMGRYNEAELAYLETIDLREKVLTKGHPDYAASVDNLAIFYTDTEQYPKAKALHLEALNTREKSLGKAHPDIAISLEGIANLYTIQGEYQTAEPLLNEAASLWRNTYGKQHPNYARNLKSQSKNYEIQSIFAVSDTLLTKAHFIQKSHLAKSITYLSLRDLTSYANIFLSDGDELASIIFNRLAKGHSTTLLPALYYNHQLFQKGFLLGAASRVGTLAATTPETEETFNRLKGFRRRLAAEYAKPIAERQNVPELEARADSLEKVFVRTVAGFGEALRQVSWQEVQATLKPGEAALEFVHYRYYDPKARATDSTLYAALVLLPSDTAPRFVPLCEARQIEATVQEAGTDELRFQNLYNALDRPASPLYPLVWQPLETHLQGVKTVYYSPSGLLHRLNLGAIQPTKRETLSDRHRLVALGSTRQLVVPTALFPAGNTAAVFGGIRYEMETSKVAAANTEDNPVKRAVGESENVYRNNGEQLKVHWKYLPETKLEAINISEILNKNGYQTDTFLGFTATEDTLQHIGNGKLPSPKVLHIATHGFFFPDPKTTVAGRQAMDNEPTFKIADNPMIRSGLLLAGAEHGWKTGKPLREGMEDGILTAYEISQMNLRNTELVVLSACETGLGDISGNEGVYGLQRAFKVAGAKYLLMSLWQVPDKATQAFMESFYAHWLDKGMWIPDAFRAAQGVARAGNANPLNWAGFVLVE